jgi:serine/threonine-protein kinase
MTIPPSREVSGASDPAGSRGRSGRPPESAPSALVTLLPSHQFGEQLGRGAFGVVYAARNTNLDRQEAVKSLATRWLADAEVVGRFVDEGRVIARLEHPHVVRVHQAARSPQAAALVMEWLGGGTLRRRFREGLTMPESCAVVLGVLAGLRAAHEVGVLHRDIKPDNVLFAGDGTPKVVDFGISQILGGAETLATSSGYGVAGTPLYMAPEQARGDLTLGPACDVYAAGVVLYELLTGDLPHTRSTDALELLRRRTQEQARPVPRSVPAPLAAVVRRSLAFAPDKRYRDAEAFAVELARAGTEVFGPYWPQETSVTTHLSAAVSRELARSAAARTGAAAEGTVAIPMGRVLPRLPAQGGPAPVSAPPGSGPGRPGGPVGGRPSPPGEPAKAADADDAPVPVRRLVRIPAVRRWPAAVAAVLALVALVLAAFGPTASPAATRDGAAPRLAGVVAPMAARADLSGPVSVTGTAPTGLPAGTRAHARLEISAAGMPLGRAASASFPLGAGQQWATKVTLASWTRWVAGGAVRGQVDLVEDTPAAGRVLASSRVTVQPVQSPIETAMGWGSLLLVLLTLASLGDVLRTLRRGGGRIGLGPVRLVLPGALFGLGAWVALTTFLARVASQGVGVAVVVLMAAALVAVGLAVTPAARTTSRAAPGAGSTRGGRR